MAQTGAGYHEEALAKKDSAKILPMSRDGYLHRLIEKQDHYTAQIAKEAIGETQDKFVEGVVYQGDPVISTKVCIIRVFAHVKYLERERKCTN
jgi:hypothetical protein